MNENREWRATKRWTMVIYNNVFFLYLYIKVNENKYRVSSHMNCKKCIHKVREKYKNEYIYTCLYSKESVKNLLVLYKTNVLYKGVNLKDIIINSSWRCVFYLTKEI